MVGSGKSYFSSVLLAVILWMTGEFTKIPIAVVALLIVGLLTIPGISGVKGWRG